MRTTSPNALSTLAAEAARLAQETRTLERRVRDAVDTVACQDAREAALHMEHLAGLLTEASRTDSRVRRHG